ncbi:thioredoxin family protein [Labilibaculum sp. K2S]|uniref:thioredoxin family protein n=1 Tax=Labilibaculum sp. K2S TaxID=3056386 RepID=UPI0025A33D2D|nr:thioredoxin family protein [Labilibaculum sp. K2S]MDM8158458.1 thioredoxin family protein [Labilibaculum sp. K2S]
MKNILLVILLFCSSLLFSQEGVKIESIPFKEALVKAEQQKKLVLIDAYTAWCGPCKWMKKQFKSAEAGLFFNKHFVFLEFDMEKEGKTLDEKYKKEITAYPTFLIIRPNGEIQHKVVGADTLSIFINMVKRGLTKETSLDYLEQNYKQGKLSKKQIVDYIIVLKEANSKKEVSEVANQLFENLTEKERVSSEYLHLYKCIDYVDWNSARFAYYLQHYKEITPMMDQKSIAYVRMAALWSHFYNYLTGMITPEENYGAELKNEIPLFRKMLKNTAIPNRDFYLALGDLSESQFLNDKIAYEREFNKILSYPVDEELYDVLMKSLHLVWGESSETMKIENKTGRMLEEKLNRIYEK